MDVRCVRARVASGGRDWNGDIAGHQIGCHLFRNHPLMTFTVWVTSSSVRLRRYWGFANNAMLKAAQRLRVSGAMIDLEEEHGNLYDILDTWMNVSEVRRICSTYYQS